MSHGRHRPHPGPAATRALTGAAGVGQAPPVRSGASGLWPGLASVAGWDATREPSWRTHANDHPITPAASSRRSCAFGLAGRGLRGRRRHRRRHRGHRRRGRGRLGRRVRRLLHAIAEMEEAEGFDAAQSSASRRRRPTRSARRSTTSPTRSSRPRATWGRCSPTRRSRRSSSRSRPSRPRTAAERLAVVPRTRSTATAIEELDNQDGPPTEEQLLSGSRRSVPTPSATETDMVADAFIAAGGRHRQGLLGSGGRGGLRSHGGARRRGLRLRGRTRTRTRWPPSRSRVPR